MARLETEERNSRMASRREVMRAEAEYYIEEYYDKVRLHGALGGLSPEAFEAAA